MKLKEVIDTLIEQGHKVEFYHRKDGGYVIRKIDGQHFTGKTGNEYARKLLGVELSIARRVQLQRIRTPKGKRQHKRTPLPDELKKELRKVQRKWREKHPTIEGTVSTRGLRYQVETYGEEHAKASLNKAYRYSQGLAYIENVMSLIERIETDLTKEESPEMEAVVDLIKERMLSFKEEWISPIYSVLYDWERYIIDGKEAARIIKQIIG